ncbi:hypothetical protein D3C87_1659550 [compost metagenome]
MVNFFGHWREVWDLWGRVDSVCCGVVDLQGVVLIRSFYEWFGFNCYFGACCWICGGDF